jgi:hypothetical protein
MLWRKRQRLLKVFEPHTPRNAAQGWALHATRRRRIHEAEARALDHLRYWLGTVSATLAAVAGTSAFAAWQSNTESLVAGVGTVVVGVGAAVLGSALTFLDFGGRAEAHRRAATHYKNVLRKFEEVSGSRSDPGGALDDKHLETLSKLLAEADETAPVVPLRRGNNAEKQPFCFVKNAKELTPNRSPECGEHTARSESVRDARQNVPDEAGPSDDQA